LFFTPRPEPNSAPPVENWMMPSDSASANPLIAALMVSDDVQLIAGNANPPFLAVSSIWL